MIQRPRSPFFQSLSQPWLIIRHREEIVKNTTPQVPLKEADCFCESQASAVNIFFSKYTSYFEFYFLFWVDLDLNRSFIPSSHIPHTQLFLINILYYLGNLLKSLEKYWLLFLTIRPYFIQIPLVFLFLFLFFLAAPVTYESSQARRLDSHHRIDPSHGSDNTRCLTHCPTQSTGDFKMLFLSTLSKF